MIDLWGLWWPYTTLVCNHLLSRTDVGCLMFIAGDGRKSLERNSSNVGLSLATDKTLTKELHSLKRDPFVRAGLLVRYDHSLLSGYPHL